MAMLSNRLLTKWTSIKKLVQARYLMVGTKCMAIPGFQDNENSYYSETLEKLTPHYCIFPVDIYKTVNKSLKLDFKIDYFNQSAVDLFKTFVDLTNTVCQGDKVDADLENAMYRSLCTALSRVLRQLSDDEVCQILSCLTMWPATESVKSHNYKTLWNRLDEECSARASHWDSVKLIQVAHVWYKLGLSRITNYNYKMINIICGQIKSLDVHTLINTLFFINLQRKIYPKFMIEIEKKILRIVEHLNLDELGIVSLAYFKTQTSIKSKDLIVAILTKSQSNFHQMNSFNVTSVAKVMRHSLVDRHDCIKECQTFQKESIKYLSNFSSSAVLHLSMMLIRQLMCDEELLKYMMSSFSKDFNDLRLKELSQSVFCISQILPNSEMTKIYTEKVIEELLLPHRQEEISQFPHQIISLLLSAAYNNVFPAKLIDRCLGDEYLKQAEDNAHWEWEREAVVLDGSVGLECPNYSGNRMSEARRLAIFKRNRAENTTTRHTSLINDVFINLSKVLGGMQFCQPCQIIPHFHHKDIIVIKDAQNKFTPIPADLKKDSIGLIVKPNSSGKWFAVFVGGRNFCNLTNKQLIGSHMMKCRQLEKLGYTVIDVPYEEYCPLSNIERVNYLRKKIEMI
ncbi:hypothetical protein CHUAL_010656 [Chamberlinius hualienensis]